MRTKAFITGILLWAILFGIEGHLKSARLCRKMIELAYTQIYFENIQGAPENFSISLSDCMTSK